MTPRAPRAIVIVLDGVGAGELPDAADYGDSGSHTLGNISRQKRLVIPALVELGLTAAVPMAGVPAAARPRANWGRMAERSPGKDSVTGHWELMGVVLDRPFPTFSDGLPAELVSAFSAAIGRPVLGNVVASGTAIIDQLGVEHCRTGSPIVYTSADSVFQIAAHEAVVPVAQLYEWCKVAYALAVEGRGMGRVIARPFTGTAGRFERTRNRHDYAMPPPADTLLDVLRAAGVPVTAIGKIGDLFAGRGIDRAIPTMSDEEGMAMLAAELDRGSSGLLFVNLVDFDTRYGHRNDVAGFAENLERFDQALAGLLRRLQPSDVLMVTADHGNDPTTPSTDHSREYVPLLALTGRQTAGRSLGTRASFADVGQTLAQLFGVGPLRHGESFVDALA